MDGWVSYDFYKMVGMLFILSNTSFHRNYGFIFHLIKEEDSNRSWNSLNVHYNPSIYTLQFTHSEQMRSAGVGLERVFHQMQPFIDCIVPSCSTFT